MITYNNDGRVGVDYKPKSAPSAPTTILIIDDSKPDRTLYKTWLNKQQEINYKIIEALNAREGYNYFLEHNPACIVLDFIMLGKNGFQLLEQMQQAQPNLPPIVFITGMHTDMVEKDAQRFGVYACLNKTTLNQENFCNIINLAVS